MELRRVGPRSIMVTCRYPKDSAEDSDACAAAAGRLVPR
jgi:hypothetical protein